VRLSRTIIIFLVLGIFAIGCKQAASDISSQAIQGLPSGSDGFSWWNDTIFYEIFVRSFSDSNGDGIGDLPGLIAKLDYLNDGDERTTNDLGISGIWLMPIHPAASYHGYDVIDYYAVNPEYGTIDDMKRLLEEAHKRGIRVIIDMVLNHTSSQHPWFQAAQDPSSEYRDWYVWSESEPTGSGWHSTPSGYYYGIFWEGMPDLNYRNPKVTEQMQDVARFWLEEVAVDGFRLDAAKHLVEDGTIQSHAQGTHDWFKEFHTYYKGLNPDAITVGEVWDASPIVKEYISAGELDLAFSFDLAGALVTSARVGRADQAARLLKREAGLFPSGQYGTFLTNHDQDRAMLLFGNNVGKAKIAASLLLTSPGVPFIYYGEEIGMIGKKPDEQIRTPMQWSSESNAGFSTGTPWIKPNDDYSQGVNVADQIGDADSLLVHYRNLIRVRNQHVALRVGEYLPLESDHEALLAFLRVSSTETVMVVINLGDEVIDGYNLSLDHSVLSGTYQLTSVFGDADVEEILITNAQGGIEAFTPVHELPAYTTLVLRLELLNE